MNHWQLCWNDSATLFTSSLFTFSVSSAAAGKFENCRKIFIMRQVDLFLRWVNRVRSLNERLNFHVSNVNIRWIRIDPWQHTKTSIRNVNSFVISHFDWEHQVVFAPFILWNVALESFVKTQLSTYPWTNLLINSEVDDDIMTDFSSPLIFATMLCVSTVAFHIFV